MTGSALVSMVVCRFRGGTRRFSRPAAFAAVVTVVLGTPVAASADPAPRPAKDWTGSWEAAGARDTTTTHAATSIRNVVHLSAGGDAAHQDLQRVRHRPAPARPRDRCATGRWRHRRRRPAHGHVRRQ